MELLGLLFGLMWELTKFALVLFLALLVPFVLFLALVRFALAVIRFGWAEAFVHVKEVVRGITGRK